MTANSLVYSSDGTFSFNGSTSQIYSTSAFATNFANGGTLEMVFQSTDINSRAQGFMQYNTGSGYLNFYSSGSGKMRWEVIGSTGTTYQGGFNNNTTLANNTWYHVVGTFNSSGLCSIYINGLLDGTQQQTNYPNGAWSATITIGQYAGYASGKIPVARVYNTCLTAGQVRANFQAIRGRYGI
jgi:hypothetical protein